MSYILDALRKSEQERQRGKVPDFSSSPENIATAPAKRNLWPIIAVAALVVNLALAGYFFMGNSESHNNSNSPAQIAPPQTQQSPAQQPVPSESQSAPQAAPQTTPQKTAEVRSTAAPKTTASLPSQSRPAPVKPIPAPVQAPKPAVTKVAEPEPIIIKPRNQTASQDVASSAPAKSEPQHAVATQPETDSNYMPNVGYLPQLEELSANQRQNIPDMTFSSHMYSSLPKYRSIIINGKRLKEGQFFNSELQVREITESGVIMSQENTLFQVDVLGRWAQ